MTSSSLWRLLKQELWSISICFRLVDLIVTFRWFFFQYSWGNEKPSNLGYVCNAAISFASFYYKIFFPQLIDWTIPQFDFISYSTESIEMQLCHFNLLMRRHEIVTWRPRESRGGVSRRTTLQSIRGIFDNAVHGKIHCKLWPDAQVWDARCAHDTEQQNKFWYMKKAVNSSEFVAFPKLSFSYTRFQYFSERAIMSSASDDLKASSSELINSFVFHQSINRFHTDLSCSERKLIWVFNFKVLCLISCDIQHKFCAWKWVRYQKRMWKTTRRLSSSDVRRYRKLSVRQIVCKVRW